MFRVIPSKKRKQKRNNFSHKQTMSLSENVLLQATMLIKRSNLYLTHIADNYSSFWTGASTFLYATLLTIKCILLIPNVTICLSLAWWGNIIFLHLLTMQPYCWPYNVISSIVVQLFLSFLIIIIIITIIVIIIILKKFVIIKMHIKMFHCK